MLFNSIEFAIFLTIVFLLYWFVINKSLKAQNILLLIASYVFYGWWDWRFMFLLALLSLANYLIGIGIENNETNRKGKIWLITGLITNLGVLGVFKYYNFFIDSFIDLVSLVGYNLPRSTTKIILPVGISFYVFLSLSYIIDIYKKNLKAYRNVVEVLLTLSFFPIILAGPIQRPASLLSQITKKREFNYDQAVDGLRQILWGLFAKVVIADKLTIYVDDIFQDFYGYSGSTLLLGALFFTIQIYADFSGYSNMAIGIAKLFGFSLIQNFAYPYFSRDITEFWKRWHISLTTWFRDYLFLPISFSISWRIKKERVFFIRTDQFIYIIASSITWFLIGLWHGANYTFIIWGVINGFFLIIYHLQRKPRKRLFKKLGINNNNSVIIGIETLITLIIIVIAWIFFRAESIAHAFQYLNGIFSPSLFRISILDLKLLSVGAEIIYTTITMLIFIILEWFQRDKQHALQFKDNQINIILRWSIYYSIILLIIYFHGSQQSFIYFQF
jgi:alginate O-acetyltransferase complex protein AlgI